MTKIASFLSASHFKNITSNLYEKKNFAYFFPVYLPSSAEIFKFLKYAN